MMVLLLLQLVIIGLVGASPTVVGYEKGISSNSPQTEAVLIGEELTTKKYDVFLKQLTFFDAILFCKERHGNLAEVRSKEENNQMTKAMELANVNYHMWIGATNLYSSRGYFWVSGNGDALNYTNWYHSGLSATGNCLAYNWDNDWSTLGWYNFDCDSPAYFACEYYKCNNPVS